MKTVSSTTTKKLSRVAAGALAGLVGLTANVGLTLAQEPMSPSQTSQDSQMSQDMNRSMARVRFVGLAPNNTLVRFSLDSRKSSEPIRVRGIDGNLIGIDFRPANGKLYGVTDTDKIYIIDPNTGAASKPVTLSASFNGGQRSGVDFNPVPDRLRLVGANDLNSRYNVDDGTLQDFDPNTPGIQRDQNLAYAPGDGNAGKDPNITAAAYTNSFAGPPSSASSRSNPDN